MRKLIMPQEAVKKHKVFFENKIVPQITYLTKDSRDFSDEEKKFGEKCCERWETLAIGTPDNLRDAAKEIDHLYQECLQSSKVNNDEFVKKIKKIFSYKMQFSRQKQPNWSPASFVKLFQARVCPYCNQNYIITVAKRGSDTQKSRLARPAIDHFYPQWQYPYLALSLYNMVPCCETCNSRLKHSAKVPLKIKTPYEYCLDEEFSFRYKLDPTQQPIAVMEIDDTCCKDRTSFDKYIEMFLLDEIYKEHKDVAENLFERYRKYGSAYFEGIGKLFGSTLTPENIDDLLWNRIPTQEDILKEPLNKMKKDLIMQLKTITKKY